MKLLMRCVYNYLRMDKQQLNIVLTPNEEKVFSTLALYRQELKLNTVMRVAGGWVRDKVAVIRCRLWGRSRMISILLWMI